LLSLPSSPLFLSVILPLTGVVVITVLILLVLNGKTQTGQTPVVVMLVEVTGVPTVGMMAAMTGVVLMVILMTGLAGKEKMTVVPLDLPLMVVLVLVPELALEVVS
jgi:hypothetical protein